MEVNSRYKMKGGTMGLLMKMGILGCGSLVALLARSDYERKQLQVCNYHLRSKKINGPIKMVMLADLHSKEHGKGNEKLLHLIKKENPDLIMIAGDMFVGNMEDDCSVALDLLRSLKEIGPVYYGLGNHEDRTKEYTKDWENSKYHWYEEQVKEMGIHVLDNESERVSVKGEMFQITGLTAPTQYFEKFNHKIMPVDTVSNLVGSSHTEAYQILLAHNPVHLESYMEWGADLSLSGHLHGGIIRLPILGGLITPQVKVLPRFSAGMYEQDGKAGIITRGLGEHTVNLRFYNLPELSVIHLGPMK